MASKKKKKTSKKKDKVVRASEVKKIEDTIGVDKNAPNQVTVTLTLEELKHIRDLMSVTIQEGGTISECLSEDEYGIGSEAENVLWGLVSDMCTGMNVPTGDDAPDYVVSVVTRKAELHVTRKEPLCKHEEES